MYSAFCIPEITLSFDISKLIQSLQYIGKPFWSEKRSLNSIIVKLQRLQKIYLSHLLFSSKSFNVTDLWSTGHQPSINQKNFLFLGIFPAYTFLFRIFLSWTKNCDSTPAVQTRKQQKEEEQNIFFIFFHHWGFYWIRYVRIYEAGFILGLESHIL